MVRGGRDFGDRVSDRPSVNASLYHGFYGLYDDLDFEVSKINGHTSCNSRNAAEKIFLYLVRHVRKSLRLWIGSAGLPAGNSSSGLIQDSGLPVCYEGQVFECLAVLMLPLAL